MGVVRREEGRVVFKRHGIGEVRATEAGGMSVEFGNLRSRDSRRFSGKELAGCWMTTRGRIWPPGLEEIVREGARKMLAVALEAEVEAYVGRFADERDDNGAAS